MSTAKNTGVSPTVEVFTAGCPLCKDTLKLIEELACEDCDVVVYNLNDPCESGECLEKVKTYGITRVPSVVVDGRLADCCKVEPISIEVLKAAGIG